MFPDEIRLVKDRAGLEIRWSDGVTHRLGAGTLRAHCRSATAIRDAGKGTELYDLDAVRITKVEPVGSYAVHLAFSDGEERGIYPWSLLRSLGE
jgi:DUF971 family protein